MILRLLFFIALMPPLSVGNRSESRTLRAEMLLMEAQLILDKSYESALKDMNFNELESQLDHLDMAVFQLDRIKNFWYQLMTGDTLKKQVEDKKDNLMIKILARRDMLMSRLEELSRSEVRESA